MATISFRIRGKEPKRNYQIKLRLSISRDNIFEVNTGLYIDAENWDFTTKFPKENKHDVYKDIALRLKLLKSNLDYYVVNRLNKKLNIDNQWLQTQIYEIGIKKNQKKRLNMSKLSEQNKLDILESLLTIVQQDHKEFDEENTTGWDLVENAKIWLDELKQNCKNTK